MARSEIRLLPLALAAACSCDGGATHGADAGADLIVVDAAADMASACGPDAALAPRKTIEPLLGGG